MWPFRAFQKYSFHSRQFAEAAHFAAHGVAVHFHHAAHVGILLEDLIHFLDSSAAAPRDALAALAVDEIVVGALGGGHRIDDGFRGFELLFVDGSIFWNFGERANLRQHAHQLLDRAHLANLLKLIAEVRKGEIVFAELALHLAGFFLVDVFLGLFDQAEDIAHTQDARDDTVGKKRLEGIVFFAHADKFHRRARNFADRKRRSAARIAIHFGEDHAGNTEALVKFAR